MPTTVTGKRRPFWRTYKDLWSAAFELGSPALVVWSLWWFVGLARGCGHDLDDDHVGPTVVGSIFFFFVGVVGIFLVSSLRTTLRSFVLVSPCPVCGADGQRDFFENKDDATPTPCGTCLAYLRAKGLEISEEPAAAFEEMRAPYQVKQAQLAPVAKHVTDEQVDFQWPAMCSVCGAADATHRRKIFDVELFLSSPPSVLGSIAGDVISSAAGISYTARVRARHTYPTKSDAEEAEALANKRLGKLTTPVCAKHTEAEARWFVPLELSHANLAFGSYRYYRAFCEQNGIRALAKA